jgi:hypothetical protein
MATKVADATRAPLAVPRFLTLRDVTIVFIAGLGAAILLTLFGGRTYWKR